MTKRTRALTPRSKDVLLVADVGNSAVKLAVALGGEPHGVVSLSGAELSPANLAFALAGLAEQTEGRLSGLSSALCAVSAKVEDQVARALEAATGKSPRRVGHDLSVPLENCYRDPGQLGADRLVAAYAARRMSQRAAVIVADCGTALTVDAVVEHRFLGGLICPGLPACRKGLADLAPRLPELPRLTGQSPFVLGRDTLSAMRTGALFGLADMTRGLVDRVRQSLGLPEEEIEVFVSGGWADAVMAVHPGLGAFAANLVLRGLSRLA